MWLSAQNRFMAKGRSRLIVKATTLSPSELTSSENFLVWMLQTGVSSEGTTLKRRTLPPESLSEMEPRLVSTQVKSGAGSPAWSLGPTRSIGLPFIVTSPLRGMDIGIRPRKEWISDAGRVSAISRR